MEGGKSLRVGSNNKVLIEEVIPSHKKTVSDKALAKQKQKPVAERTEWGPCTRL